MKRGKDGEKIMGPMFPRLHVNDKEKGGPRAPPRNKMALYEQLSIPTQRFNSGVMLQNPSCTSSSVHPPSSSQGHSLERNLHLAHSVSPSTSSQRSEKFNSRQPARAALTTPLSQPEQRKMVGEEDDFAVPVYFRPGLDDSSGETENGIDKGRPSPSRQTYSGHSIRFQNNTNQDPKRSSSSRSASPENLSARDASAEPVKESSASPIQECEDLPTLSFRRSNNSITSSHQESRARTQQNGCSDGDDSMRGVEKEADPQPRGGSHSREGYGCPNEPNNRIPNHGDNTCGSMQLGNGDKSDDFSEISMVDSMSDMDITPDDMVGIIGQKHFWKARRAIANQQRVFAVQVFELHRLIKVQKLIAGSPQLIHDESAFLGKPSIKASPAKKLPSQYVVKPLPLLKRKDSLENPAHKMEFSAENAVSKTPPSVKNGSHPLNYGPYHANPPPTLPMPTSDSRMNPWCYHQSPGHHQWLVPVMSASEGLIYKPYPGPGFMGSVCGGGCGQYGMMPISGNFMNPAYGVPPPAHQQGIGVPPASHPVGHGFFPPYGMPVLSPSIQNSAQEQKNQFVAPSSNGSEAHNNTKPHETSCYVPSQKSGANPRAVGFQASRETELQGSTASSPSERVLANGMATAAEGREAVSPFPTTAAAVVPEGAAQPHETEQLTRVIRVVPHNPRSATESAARIFQSIQEERKHYDSV